MVENRAGGVAVAASTCPICGDARLKRLATPYRWIGEGVFGPYREHFGVTRCRGCSFVFINPRPSDALLARFYSGNEYNCHSPESTDSGGAHAAHHVLDVIERHAPGKRLLDYGCGAGVTLAAAVRRGWDASGFDVGQAAVANCRRQGLRATDDVAELPSQGYDAILLNHVFEHITDPRATLAELARLLAPDGRLFIGCPNVESLRARLSLPPLARSLRFDERFRAFPIHVSYFSPRTLPQLLESAGFVVREVMTFGMGIDELIYQETDAAPPPAPARAASANGHGGRPSVAKQAAKNLVKSAIYRTGLGENLLVVAALPS